MKEILKLSAMALTLSLMLASCTSETDASRALTAQGFTNVEVTGYDFFACSKDDFYHTGFTAKNTQGTKVTGTVCSGLLFKSATIRY